MYFAVTREKRDYERMQLKKNMKDHSDRWGVMMLIIQGGGGGGVKMLIIHKEVFKRSTFTASLLIMPSPLHTETQMTSL